MPLPIDLHECYGVGSDPIDGEVDDAVTVEVEGLGGLLAQLVVGKQRDAGRVRRSWFFVLHRGGDDLALGVVFVFGGEGTDQAVNPTKLRVTPSIYFQFSGRHLMKGFRTSNGSSENGS